MAQSTRFTAAEAAFVLREPIRSVKKALDSGPVRPVLRHGSGTGVRTIGWADLFYLFAVRALREELTPKARVAFYNAVRHERLGPGAEVRFGRFRVAVDDLIGELERRAAGLVALADKVVFRDDGEAVLKGTDVEVHRIAALLDGGMSVDSVLEDYPSLSRDSIETARAYADAHPRPGHPYPRTTLKRALHGAGLEDLDEVLGSGGAVE
jgi:uncharacterized protein (DUF433 family)